jgi:vancomycin aglycone glucosyltransferase
MLPAMRILLSTIGSRGDVQPLLALALQLRALGDEVQFCVPPDFRTLIEERGFPVTPIGPELRGMTTARFKPPTVPLDPEQRRQLAEASVAAQFSTVADAARGCDAIVAATALQIATRSVADRLDVGYVFAAYCPAVLPSPHHAPPPLPPLPGDAPLPETASHGKRWERDAQRFHALFGPSLNAHRARIGLPEIEDVRSHIFGGQAWLAADAILAPWPDPTAESPLQTGAWMRVDERPLPRPIDAFLDSGDAPLYFGLGSMRSPQQDVSRVMIESARALGRRVILSRGWAGLELIDDAADCLSIDEVNQQALFPRVAAVVHHGGAGTTTAAFAAGVPQVVIPQVYDQHYWAHRVETLGVGVTHAVGTISVSSLGGVLERALRRDVVTCVEARAAEVRRDGAEIAARRLRRLFG